MSALSVNTWRARRRGATGVGWNRGFGFGRGLEGRVAVGCGAVGRGLSCTQHTADRSGASRGGGGGRHGSRGIPVEEGQREEAAAQDVDSRREDRVDAGLEPGSGKVREVGEQEETANMNFIHNHETRM